MFKFSVADKKYELPQTQYEIEYGEGIAVQELEKAYGGETLQYKLRVLQMLSGCDRLADVVDEEIEAIFKGLPLFSGKTGIVLSDCIRMKKKKYGLIDLDSLTVQHYMEIEKIMDSVENPSLAASSLSALIYLPIEKHKRSFKSILINLLIRLRKSKFIKPFVCKSYELKELNLKDADKRVEEIEKHFSYGDCLSVLYYYLDWKQKLAKEYFIIFKEDEKKDIPKPDSKKKLNMSSIWGLYNQLALMHDKNYNEMEKWLDRPVKKFMYHLSYMVQSNNFEKNNK